MRSGVRGAALVCLIGALAAASCVAPLPTIAPSAPQHPEFVPPTVPPGSSQAVVGQLARAWQALQAGDLPKAGRDYTDVAQRHADQPAGPTGLAYVALARRQSEAAVEGFSDVLRRWPEEVPALVGRGLALVATSREADAVRDFTAAVTRDPSLVEVARRADLLRARLLDDAVARARAATAAGRVAEARVAFDAAVAVAPEAAFLYRERALLERRAGAPAEALRAIRRATALDPADAGSHAVLGELLAEAGEVPAALEAYRRARSLDPNAVPDAVLRRLEEQHRAGALRAEYQAIAGRTRITRAELAALVAVRFDDVLRRQPARPVIATDLRGHWARPWMELVARTGVIDVYPNGTFDPAGAVRRIDLAEVVARLLGMRRARGPSGAGSPRPPAMLDVPPAHLGYPAVAAAVTAGVLPLRDGRFGLLESVSGQEAADALARLAAVVVPGP